jgi:hypothetical protein
VNTSATPRSAVELSMALSLLRASHTRALIFIQILLVLALGLSFWLLIEEVSSESNTGAEVFNAALQGALDAHTGSLADRVLGLGLLAGLLLSMVMLWQQSRARLRVGIEGIQASMPEWLGWSFFKQTGGDWKLRWGNINSVRLEAPKRFRSTSQGLRFYRLVINTGKDEIRINPYAWFNPNGADHRMGMREVFGTGKSNPQRIHDAPLMQLLRARGIEIAGADDAELQDHQDDQQFDLGSHKGIGLQVVLLLLLGGYFAVDYFMLAPYQALQALPQWPFLLALPPAMVLIFISGRGAPKQERIAIGIMLLAAMLAAVYPATLRYNALDAEIINATYEATAVGHFKALNGELPDIDMSGHRGKEYWQQLERGSLHDFTLLRGKAGFYQLQMQPLNQKIRAWYEKPGEQ